MNQDYKFYRCFSGKLKKFLLEQGNDYVMRANDYYTKKTFWLFERTEKLDKSLSMWKKTDSSN